MPEGQGWEGSPGPESAGRAPLARPRGAIGPVLAGIILDAIDLVTQGPFGVPLGIVIGGPAAFFMARGLGLSRSNALLLGFLAGLYCAMPHTARLPLGTLVGLYARFVRGM